MMGNIRGNTLCLSSELEDKIAYFNYRRHTPVKELTSATSALLNRLVREYEVNEALKRYRA